MPLIKYFCKALGSPGVKRMCIPILFSLLSLAYLYQEGKNESSSLWRDLGDVKELPCKDVRSNTTDLPGDVDKSCHG